MMLKVYSIMEVEEQEKRIHVDQDWSLLYLVISMSYHIDVWVVFECYYLLSLWSSFPSLLLLLNDYSSMMSKEIDRLIARDVHR